MIIQVEKQDIYSCFDNTDELIEIVESLTADQLKNLSNEINNLVSKKVGNVLDYDHYINYLVKYSENWWHELCVIFAEMYLYLD